MEVLRGRAGDVTTDATLTHRLVDRVGEIGTPAIRVWRPPRQVAFGRRDTHDPGYRRARRAAAARGYPPVERPTGGRAVVHTGQTLAFVQAEPVSAERTGVDDRYERTTTAVQTALADLGIPVRPGEPPDAFCPGPHSLQATGKLAGLAQRIGGGVATVGGIIIVADRVTVVDILTPVYGALDVPLDPAAVDSVAHAGGPADLEPVSRALERALVGDAPQSITHVGEPRPPVRET